MAGTITGSWGLACLSCAAMLSALPMAGRPGPLTVQRAARGARTSVRRSAGRIDPGVLADRLHVRRRARVRRIGRGKSALNKAIGYLRARLRRGT